MELARKAGRLVPVRLAAALGVQAVAAVFVVMDVIAEMALDPWGWHPLSEGVISVGLFIGMGFVTRSLVRSLRQGRAQMSALAIAAGEFRRVIEAHFDGWHLTPAEREVALMSLRGMELDRIAALRAASTSTVRAQLARIYAKSGTANRAQLSAVFVEKLMRAGEPAAQDQTFGDPVAPDGPKQMLMSGPRA